MRNFPADEVEVALDDLQARKLLSDERFAESLVRHRTGQGYGPLRIRMELERQGIDAGSYLVPYVDAWPEIARRAYAKHFGTATATDMKDRARRARYLEGRGFTHDVIRAVIDMHMRSMRN